MNRSAGGRRMRSTVDRDGSHAAGDPVATKAEARAAAGLWRAGATVLDTGIPGAGAVTEAVLYRAAHDARAAKLHRGAAAAIRVAEHLRSATTAAPTFRLDDLVRDLRELLSVAHRLRQPGATVGTQLRGTARREYRAMGGAQLYGLCVEPIATASGYGGAATLLGDEAGQVWQVSTVVPGGGGAGQVDVAELARFSATTPVSIGDVRLTHADLAREGMLAAQLAVSADGRISGGRGTQAVRAEGGSWFAPPLDTFWQVPWSEQIERYLRARELSPIDRPAVKGLVFVDATLAGAAAGGVVLATAHTNLLAVAAHESPQLAYVDNLRRLAEVSGAAVRLIARPVGRRRVAPIALAASWLPENYRGHVDLGLEWLRGSDLPGDAAPTRVSWELPDDTAPLHPLRRRVERIVEGGRAAATGDAGETERMGQFLPYAAALARRLEATSRPCRDAYGRLATESEAEDFTRAWLAAATYVATALRAAERDDWRGGS